MQGTIMERLQLQRRAMAEKSIQASIITSSDPHQSEYPATCWKYREYLSGFTGSAGTLVIGKDNAGLWTDSRYFLQAESELQGSGIELFKAGLPDTPEIKQWIYDQGYKSVGVDGSVFSADEASELEDYFSKKEILFISDFKPYESVWPNRPKMPDGKLEVFSESYSGETIASKISRVRSYLAETGAQGMPISSLDDIAWLYNFRGSDIEYNPVSICYAYVDMKKSYLFVRSEKITPEFNQYMVENNIEISEYEGFEDFISDLDNIALLFDKSRNSYRLLKCVPESCRIINKMCPVTLFKARKNDIEIAGFRESMKKDGAALVKFMKWLETETSNKNSCKHAYPDEWAAGEKIAEFRKEQEGYVCESFAPIAGFREHGAIVHYEAENTGSSVISGEGALLLDLGAHYLTGTTDITRTIYLNGEPSRKYKEDYACLLKGVIALTKARFPEGTRGTQLDVLARQFLWERGLNFLHGTGHGIGHCLYVHEGPQSIRMNENPVRLEPGMVTSNEPGIYRAGEYGIRLENAILVCDDGSSSYGNFYSFDTLTLFPFDIRSIDSSLFSNEELEWINNYHRKVFEELSPRLNEDETAWLKEKTSEIYRYN